MSIFNTSDYVKPPRLNKFDLSKERLTSAEMGILYPVFSEHMVPGDFFKVSTNAVLKTAPLFAPIYSNMRVDFHAFFVPYRLMWRKFDKWIYDVTDDENLPPHVSKSVFDAEVSNSAIEHNLLSDVGGPINELFELESAEVVNPDEPYTIWDLLAYHKIYNDCFRNENLDTECSVVLDDELQNYDDLKRDLFAYHYRNYAKDYFTAALPTPQRGMTPYLSVLANSIAPVYVNARDYDAQNSQVLDQGSWYGVNFIYPSSESSSNVDLQAGLLLPDDNQSNIIEMTRAPKGALSLYTDLSQAAQGFSAADFRSLMAVSRYLEINMTGGDRYDEGTLSYYGVKVRDLRAQKPEFLGMCSTNIAAQEVVANAPDSQGQLGAYGDALALGRPFRYFASEHGVFMIIMSIRPKNVYGQGLPRKFRMSDRFDYPLPIFQHLGEQEVKNYELFYSGTAEDELTFGYESRYAEWRSSFDEVKGDFATSLKNWHLARFFDKVPSLDSDFIVCRQDYADRVKDAELNRIFNYTGKAADHFWVSLYFRWIAKRPFSYHTKPMLIG